MNRPMAPILTELETQVMEIIWKNKQSSASEILCCLESKGIVRSNSALRSQLKALVKKGYLEIKQEGKTYYYSAVLLKRDAIHKTVEQVKNQFFSGSSSSIFRFLLKDKNLSQEELDEMQSEIMRLKNEKEL